MEGSGSWYTRWNIRLYYVSIMLLAASIPLSKFTTSVSEFLVLGFWLLYDTEGRFRKYAIDEHNSGIKAYSRYTGYFLLAVFDSLLNKFRLFFRNRIALLVASVLLMHVTGLLYTTDFHYAFKDLRTKLPLFLLPLFLSSGPTPDHRTLRWILYGYVTAIIGGTIYRLFLYLNLPVADTRALSAHISHIRFSLNADLAIFILMYYIENPPSLPRWAKYASIAVIAWLIFFMAFMGYMTGLSILSILVILFVIYRSFRKTSLKVRLAGVTAGLLIILVPALYFYQTVENYRHTQPVSFQALTKYTANGNSYYHDTVNFRIEHGRYTGLYICDKELRKEWARRSKRSIESLDDKQQPIRFTLIRYLSSMNVAKDSAGIAKLTERDIQRIEAGQTQANPHPEFSPKTQIENFLTGWDNYWIRGNPNSSSLIQRIEYWRTSLALIRLHPVIGTGTGDVPGAFSSYYDEHHSQLDPQFRLRSHNQYLSITVAFGLAGLAWFLVAMIYPVFYRGNYKKHLFLVFWIIFMLSMLTEDTIETQEGVTFYAFFTSLFLLACKPADQEDKLPEIAGDPTGLKQDSDVSL